MSEIKHTPRFKFGDIIENGWAGEGNPHKRGIFLWTFVRAGRMNAGKHVKLLYDDGERGELLIADDDKMTVVGTIFEADKARIAALEEALEQKWRPMDTAPRDGKHCILAVQRGPFVYAVQGAFMSGKWSNAADIDAEPLCWMPNVMIPDEFLPWTDAFKARVVLRGTP